MTPDQLPQAIQSMLQTLQAGQAAQARAQAETILRAVPGEPNAAQVLAMALLREGEAQTAMRHLTAAEQAAPGHPPILNMLGVAHKQLGLRDEARNYFEKAVAADENFVDARLNLAQLDIDAGEFGSAARQFDAALALQPQNVTALAGRARAALLGRDEAQAVVFAEKALDHAPGHVLATLTLTLARLQAEDFEGALEIALPLSQRGDVGVINQAFAAGHAADACDRLGSYEKAFALYTRSNELLANHHKALADVPESPFSPAVIEEVSRRLGKQGLARAPDCPDEARMPAFLVGFPRSGTTLLEQILMTHPRVESFGEHAALKEACGHFYTRTDGLAALDALDAEGAAACRETYWREIAKLGPLADGQVLLDKLPLNSVLLPVIAKVFPRAKILFALRDPRDVVFSCFQRRFGMNAAMYQLLTLESAARYYDLVMDLAAKTRELCDLSLLEIRYEDTVADVEGKARETLVFLGLDWDPGVMNYREAARTRRIDTPSVGQVMEPIYTRAQGKWRHYETHLAPVRGILDPWAARLGYE